MVGQQVAFRAGQEFLKDLDEYVAKLQKELGPAATVTRSSVIKTIVRERLDQEKRKGARKRKG